MLHIKGHRFDFPLINRVGVLKHLAPCPVGWNTHTSTEVHYLLKGNTTWEFRKSCTPLSLVGGTFAVIPAGVEHRAFGDNGTPAIRLGIIMRNLVGRHSHSDHPFTPDDLVRINQTLADHCQEAWKMSSTLFSRVREFADELSLDAIKTPEGRLHLRILAASLIDETVRTLNRERPLLGDDDVIPKIKKWIDGHCAESITPDKLVKLSGYGRSRFYSLFLAESGMTPIDYLIRARIKLAKRELAKKATNKSMLNLAMDCGFSSASVFSTTFRKHVGMSPREFRNHK